MEMKRFVGRDVRTALRLVREQMGPDAMILSNSRTVDGVEVVAAPAAVVAELSKGPRGVLRDIGTARDEGRPVDLPAAMAATGAETQQPPLQEATGSLRDDIRAVDKALRPPSSSPASTSSPALREDRDSLHSVQKELSTLRCLLEKQLAAAPPGPVPASPQENPLAGRLTRLGLSRPFAKQIAEATGGLVQGEQAWREAQAILREQLPLAGDVVAAGGCFAMVGPTGAGKTTTLCKLAVTELLKHGADQIAIISLDRFRLGAGETLRTLGRITGIKVEELPEVELLPARLKELTDHRLVLIDTAGLSGQDPARERQLATLAALGDRVSKLLVVPASSQASSLRQSCAQYSRVRPVACVITRLDDTGSLGEAVEMAIRAALPVAYTTDGPEIPDDISVADGMEMLRSAENLCRIASAAGDEEELPGDQMPGEWIMEGYNGHDGLVAAAP